MVSLAESILACGTPKPVAELVPEWDCTVHIKVMSGAERDAWDQEQYERREEGTTGDNWRARFLARTLCLENGTPIFTPEQAEALGRQNGLVLARLFEKASAMNGMGASGADAKKN